VAAWTDRTIGLIARFAQCCESRRDGELIEHQVRKRVGQRVFGLAPGYEDLNDHDDLRHDSAVRDVAGQARGEAVGLRALDLQEALAEADSDAVRTLSPRCGNFAVADGVLASIMAPKPPRPRLVLLLPRVGKPTLGLVL
jgi:hypothetical protein